MNFFFELDDDDLQFLETETIPVKAVTTLFKRKRNDLEEGEIEEFPSKKQNDLEEGEIEEFSSKKQNDLEEGEIEEFPSKKQNDLEEGEIEEFPTPKTRICNDSYYFDKTIMKRVKLYI